MMTQYSKNSISRYELNLKTSTLALLSALSMIPSANAAYTPWDAVSEHLTESMIGALPSSARKVAVVDNGFAKDHSGLKNQLVGGYNGRDDNESIDASIIMDKKHHAYGKLAPHGTHVAGIIAQMNPQIEIVPVKRGSRGTRTSKSDVACLQALIGREDIEVVNLSFGVSWNEMIDPIMQLAQEGKTIVIAAGNEESIVHDQYISSKGKFLSDILKSLNGRVVFVEATEKKDGVQKLAKFSNRPAYDMSEFFISAPGRDIISYVPLDTDSTGMEAESGTSMAAPTFAGAMLRLATKFNVSVDEARSALFKTAIKGKDLGQGAIDFVAAYNLLKNKGNQPQNQMAIPEEAQAIDEEPAVVNEDLLRAQIFVPEAINEDLLRAQIFEPEAINEDLLRAQIFEPEAVNEDLLRAQIFTTGEKPKSLDEKAPQSKEKVVEQEEVVKEKTTATLPQQSEGYISSGINLLKNGLETVYQGAQTVASYVAAPFQSAYQYLSSWF